MSGLNDLPRALRRSVYAIEDRARRSGAWGEWQRVDVRGRAPGDDWMREVHTVFKTDWLVVMVRTAATVWGPVEHAIIRTARNAELGWAEKQRIKNELFGQHRLAVEVMPAADRVVDAADIYHLWVLPDGFAIPFGIHRADTPTPGGLAEGGR
ncbi:UNVERIFIED_CONTAM: hypothetical protein Q9R58_07695 [Methylobacteriaceae bacterium AG10]|nr:hypothetical protein [Methylobacteriaceae bacterium AG10]